MHLTLLPVARLTRTARCGIAALILLTLARPVVAQPDVAVMAGYGVSFFDDDFMRELTSSSHGGEIPIGLAAFVPIVGGIAAGVELRLSLIPFTWEYRKSGAPPGKVTVSQNAASAVVRYDLGHGPLLPYCRAGVGLYGGAMRFRYEDQSLYPDGDFAFQNSLGMSLSAGVRGAIGSDKFWFGEILFHAVRRTLDGEGHARWRANSCGVQGGVGRRF